MTYPANPWSQAPAGVPLSHDRIGNAVFGTWEMLESQSMHVGEKGAGGASAGSYPYGEPRESENQMAVTAAKMFKVDVSRLNIGDRGPEFMLEFCMYCNGQNPIGVWTTSLRQITALGSGSGSGGSNSSLAIAGASTVSGSPVAMDSAIHGSGALVGRTSADLAPVGSGAPFSLAGAAHYYFRLTLANAQSSSGHVVATAKLYWRPESL